ncbi:hypothetical protein SAMN05421780_109127 [Flexibacter flexilis DSM 6793]|uniref:Dolichyl-phosphate-mannose-protein mannosyltransferase n=1 Tax=Flexibacter flexilis DSM 6793 TaxID=927664 RepID=A0A1I1LTM1_9BACT|nr:hypothetical protein [Flexibacter flexilis]SFC76399.1 hypothetical protein SAMN05421780_109127 [Flexibacter flexilis DSM 6793]
MQPSNRLPYWYYVWPSAVYALLTLLCADNSFFWDNIMQASKAGQWYYNTNLSTLILPTELDAGHPPLFGLYLAAVWKLMGQSLAVSHWAIFPLLLGIGWQATRLAALVSPDRKWVVLITAFLLADTALLAQASQVSPDLALTFFALWAVANILTHSRREWLAISLLGLVMVSTRGILLGFGIGLAELIILVFIEKAPNTQTLLKRLGAYIPAILLVLAWLWWHYHQTGWVGYNPASQWSANYERVGVAGFFRNIIIMKARLLELGRVATWLVMTLAAVVWWRKRVLLPLISLKIFAFLVGIMVVLAIFMLPYANPIGHRYLILPALMASLLAMQLLLFLWEDGTQRRWIYRGALLVLLSGHLWIYPAGVAMGWDSTLAHIPYFGYRKQAVAHLKAYQIPAGTVGSDFPNLASFWDTDLMQEPYFFKEKNLKKDDFVLESNIMNGFSDEELADLRQHWQVRREWGGWPVYMRLYERKPH